MKKSVASRLALISAAAVFIAACSSTEGPVSPVMSPPDGPAFGVPGVFAAGVVTACIDATSPAANYSFATTVANQQPGDVVTTPAAVTIPTPQCADVLVRTDADADFAVATVTASMTAEPAGVWSWTCVSDSGAGCPDGAASIADDNSSRGGENALHGTTLTFHFEPDAVTGTGCTLTQGWWKNKFGSVASAAFDFDGGTDNGLTVLNTPPKKGNVYLILAHQYIAASLNVAAGASMDDGGAGTADDVLSAYNAATAYFLVASAAAPLPAGYTAAQVTALAATLDAYNNGLLGPGHCDEIVPV